MSIYIDILSRISTKNKYYFWCISIITSAKNRSTCRSEATELLTYVEGHHIIPKSFGLGGEQDNDNIVFLTAKEHIVVHHIMCKFLVGKYKVKSLQAFHCMVFQNNGGKNKRYPTVGQLAAARAAASEANKGKRGITGVPDWFGISRDINIFKEILVDHVVNNMSDPEIGRLYGVSAACIHSWRGKLHIRKRRWQLRNKAWLEERYYQDMLSCQQIANIIGCTSTAVQQKFQLYGMNVRNASERQINVDRDSFNHREC
jgi:hypothetical protein